MDQVGVDANAVDAALSPGCAAELAAEATNGIAAAVAV